ncbi:hypothetical protein NL676_030400 [Syzygium grande]|nr:hypothetical protein NL676_030400 [Syzygium grande]
MVRIGRRLGQTGGHTAPAGSQSHRPKTGKWPVGGERRRAAHGDGGGRRGTGRGRIGGFSLRPDGRAEVRRTGRGWRPERWVAVRSQESFGGNRSRGIKGSRSVTGEKRSVERCTRRIAGRYGWSRAATQRRRGLDGRRLAAGEAAAKPDAGRAVSV